MPYSIAIGPIQIVSESSSALPEACTCNEAKHALAPSFVFSVAGQVGFRSALDHLLTCNARECTSLRKRVKDSMHDKLTWLFEEEALLGCVHVQPFLYKAKRAVDVRRNSSFKTVASHLSRCPHESCATLRRALLLTIRNAVSPSALATAAA